MNKIRSLRESIKLTKTEFANLLKISTVYLYYIENNIKFPSIKIAYRIKEIAKQNDKELSLDEIFSEFNIHGI